MNSEPIIRDEGLLFEGWLTWHDLRASAVLQIAHNEYRARADAYDALSDVVIRHGQPDNSTVVVDPEFDEGTKADNQYSRPLIPGTVKKFTVESDEIMDAEEQRSREWFERRADREGLRPAPAGTIAQPRDFADWVGLHSTISGTKRAELEDGLRLSRVTVSKIFNRHKIPTGKTIVEIINILATNHGYTGEEREQFVRGVLVLDATVQDEKTKKIVCRESVAARIGNEEII